MQRDEGQGKKRKYLQVIIRSSGTNDKSKKLKAQANYHHQSTSKLSLLLEPMAADWYKFTTKLFVDPCLDLSSVQIVSLSYLFDLQIHASYVCILCINSRMWFSENFQFLFYITQQADPSDFQVMISTPYPRHQCTDDDCQVMSPT
jgi:hypothetical protein